MAKYLVQEGRYKSKYKIRWSFDNENLAYMYYHGLNIGKGYKKRLLKDGEVIERYIS